MQFIFEHDSNTPSVFKIIFMMVDSESSNIFLPYCTSELVVIHLNRQSAYRREQYQAFIILRYLELILMDEKKLSVLAQILSFL